MTNVEMQLSSRDESDQTLNSVLLTGLLIRVSIAFYNTYVSPVHGSESDAQNFHDYAVSLALGFGEDKSETTGWIYGNALAFVYSVFGPSLLLGGLLSCTAWFASAIILVQICRNIGLQSRKIQMALAIYAYLPASVLMTSVTLREPYQMLFTNGLVLSGLRMLEAGSIRSVFVFLVNSIGGSLLHLALGVGAVGTAVVFIMTKYAKWLRENLVIALLFAGAALALFGSSIQNSEVADALTKLRSSTDELARANYHEIEDFSSIADILISLPAFLFQYLCEPLPWRFSSLLDVYAFLENAGRLALLFYAVRAVWARDLADPKVLFVLAAWLSFEGMWSIGTTNWGTALRHHLPAMGCLLAAGFAGTLARHDPSAAVQAGRKISSVDH